MNRLQQIVQIVRRAHTVNDFRSHLLLEFGSFASGNVFHAAFVAENFAGAVPHGSRIFRNPDEAAIAPAHLIFEPLDDATLRNRSFEFLSPLRIRVDYCSNVADRAHQFFG